MRYRNLKSEQTIDAIERLIDENHLEAHDALPAERKLAEILNVSRGTLREAIQRMCAEGRLYSVYGKGNFMAQEKEKIDMKDMISFSGSVKIQGKLPGSRLIQITKEPVEEVIAGYLNIEPGEAIYKISRIRTVDKRKILLEISHIPEKKCPELERFDFEKMSLYDVLERVYNITMQRQDITVRLSTATQYEARYLDIGYQDPVFVEKGVSYTSDQTPIEFTKTIVNASRAEYTITIKSA